MGGKRALIFAAVSSEEQASDDKASLDGQVEQARAAAENAGYTVVREVIVPGASRKYYDPEVAKREVPQYAELEAAVERRSVDVVVSRSTDRVARGEGVLHWLFGLFGAYDVVPWSLEDGPLPVDPDPLLQAIKAWRAEAEMTARRGPTGNLLPGLIMPGSTGGAKQGVFQGEGEKPATKTILPPPWGPGGGRTKGGKRPNSVNTYIVSHFASRCWMLALRQAYDFQRKPGVCPTNALRLACGAASSAKGRWT